MFKIVRRALNNLAETVDTVFTPDLIEYAFEGVSLSDAKFMGEEY